MKILIVIVFFLLNIVGCSNEIKSENYYPDEVIAHNLYSKFDNAMYQVYKLNILQNTGIGLIRTNKIKSYDVSNLLNSNLYNGRTRFLGDTTIFSFLIINQNKELISPLYFVNSIGYVKDSIKFIEINDGSFMEISDKELSTFDNAFAQLINSNQDSLSNQLQFVLKQNKFRLN